MHVDEKSLQPTSFAGTCSCAHLGQVVPVHNQESVSTLLFLIPLFWTVANRQSKKEENVSRADGLYAVRLIG